jgi:hypothetical protein
MNVARALGHGLCAGLVAAGGALAAGDRPVVALTRAELAERQATYFNCDRLGSLGCLRAACRAGRSSRENAADIQYLYREVADGLPGLLTSELRACFVRAGGRFR